MKTLVDKWRRDVLLASSIAVGLCDSGDEEAMVGFTLYAQNNDEFAHAHMSLDAARELYRDLGEAIMLADPDTKKRH
jgi:hypothetical protein